MPLVWLVLLSLLLSTNSWAATFFVAPTGDDAGLGTAVAPWRTIQKCADTAANGDTCSINDGTYSASHACPGPSTCVVDIDRPGIIFRSTIPFGAILNGLSNATEFGFFLTTGGSSSTVRDFTILGFEKGGVFIQNNSNLSALNIDNNIIHDIGRKCTSIGFGLDGVFVGTGTNNSTIKNNWIYTIGRFIGPCTAAENAEIRADHAIYLNGTTNITIQRNLIYDMKNGFHVHTQATNTGLKIYNNTFADPILQSSGQIIVASPMVSGDITNNIFYNPGQGDPSQGAISIIGGTFSNTIVRNNLTNSARWWYLGGGSATNTNPSGITTFSGNVLSTDPLFTNVAVRNYTLAVGSPAIDTGFALTGFTFNGSGLDKGFLETSGTDTTAPAPPTGVMVR